MVLIIHLKKFKRGCIPQKRKQKSKNKSFETKPTKTKLVDTFVFPNTTSVSSTLVVRGSGWIILSKLTGLASGFPFCTEVVIELVNQKY